MIRMTKITTDEILGTKRRFKCDKSARKSSPTAIMTEKPAKPAQKPVLTSDMAISIGVNVPIVLIPTTLRIKTTIRMPKGKTVSHFKAFCSSRGRP